MSTALVWFQLDLRLAANAALERALATAQHVIPVFIYAPEEENPWAPGAASRWWLHHSLEALEAELAERGSRLIIRRGPSAPALVKLAEESAAKTIFWNRRYEAALAARDGELEKTLRKHGVACESLPGNVLFEPGAILNSSGQPFQVFTPFWRACLARPEPEAPKAPAKIPGPAKWPAPLRIAELDLRPKVDWTAGLRESWTPGEQGARKQIRRFLHNEVESYPADRDRPDQAGTSRISPHLHFGEISAKQIWHAARNSKSKSHEPYLRQIAWREFSYHLLHHYPHTADQPLRPEFRFFPWNQDENAKQAWQCGETGYPMVDAGMRELWHTGWMHNRVRMLVASFLVKHLLIPWQEGARWFWDTLVDADLANNTMGWQWTAGCGAGAAPYFRIFNPVLQGEKFDPDGAYVRRWVPELVKLSPQWIHKPWEAPGSALAEAGIELGRDYPRPIVAHDFARKRALASLAEMKASVNP